MTRTTPTMTPTTTRACALAFALLCCSPLVHSWKQLTPPTSFSISQQHPAAGGQHHHTLNALGDDGHQHQLHGGDGAHSSSSITFGGGGAYDGAGPTISTHVGHGPTYSTSSSSSPGSSSSEEEEERASGHGQSEPRILHHGGGDAVFESNYYSDLGAPSVSTWQRMGSDVGVRKRRNARAAANVWGRVDKPYEMARQKPAPALLK